MSKKFGKFLLFSAVAGAAAYGAYQYLQKKDKATVLSGKEEEDDPDDFSEDLDEEPAPSKERSYVSLNLDKAEAFANEAFQKAKEVITDSVQKVKETVLESAEKSEAKPVEAVEKPADKEAPAEETETETPAAEATKETISEEAAPATKESSTPEALAGEPVKENTTFVTEEFPLE